MTIRIGRMCIAILIMASSISAHSPYGMWYKWRKDRLFIVTTASDSLSYPLGVEITDVLKRKLPRSEPLAVRAPTTLTVLKLLLSHQFDVALLPLDDLRRAVNGEGEFQEIAPWISGTVFSQRDGPNPLRVIARLGSNALISEDHFSNHRAHLLAELLSSNGRALTPALNDRGGEESPLSWHDGTESFMKGRPLPERPDGEKSWVK